ncbi:MAG: LEPR-XLL domain-containing protein, partial [Planctomycetaceae bacterium]|nr:LEPR-XLL domain-containing protein [Planctomycetaceae bacterium]
MTRRANRRSADEMITSADSRKRRSALRKIFEGCTGSYGTRRQLGAKRLGFETLEPRQLLSASPNQPPVNLVPGSQVATENVPLAFAVERGNVISTSDPDAGNNP